MPPCNYTKTAFWKLQDSRKKFFILINLYPILILRLELFFSYIKNLKTISGLGELNLYQSQEINLRNSIDRYGFFNGFIGELQGHLKVLSFKKI